MDVGRVWPMLYGFRTLLPACSSACALSHVLALAVTVGRHQLYLHWRSIFPGRPCRLTSAPLSAPASTIFQQQKERGFHAHSVQPSMARRQTTFCNSIISRLRWVLRTINTSWCSAMAIRTIAGFLSSRTRRSRTRPRPPLIEQSHLAP